MITDETPRAAHRFRAAARDATDRRWRATSDERRRSPTVRRIKDRIALIAALANKRHHKKDKEYDPQGTGEFDRGYRDGLYNAPYHNYGRSDAYSIWNRRASRQCVQMTVADGRVYDIRDIGTHPRCR